MVTYLLTIQNNMMQFDIQYDVMWYVTTQYDTIQYYNNTIWYYILWYMWYIICFNTIWQDAI